MKFASAGLALALSSNAFAANIAIYDDLYGTPWSGTAATSLGHSVGTFYLDCPGFRAAGASANMLIVESPNYGSAADCVTAIADAVAAGKPVIVEYWKFQADPAFNAALAISAVDYYTPMTHPGSGTPNFFSSFGGTLVWNGLYNAGINGSVLTTTAGGTYHTTDHVITVTRGGKAVTNGYLSYDHQDSDSDGDGTLDVVETYKNEIAYLLGGGGPSIALGGSCPSAVSVAASGFTPGGTVAIVKSNGTGSFAIPSGPCAGVNTGLSSSGVGLVTTLPANPSGQINYSGSVGAALCTKYFVFVDLATCTPSNVDTF